MTEERDYSHRSLMDKLGVRAGHRVYTKSVDGDFLDALESELEAPPAARLSGAFDLIFLHVNAPRELDAIERLAGYLTPEGGLWIFHPKGKGASPTDSQVRAAGIAAGLVDNKICAYTASHTATRYVIPRAKRPSSGAVRAPRGRAK